MKTYRDFLINIFSRKKMYETVKRHSLGRIIGYYALTAVFFSILIGLGLVIFGTTTINSKINEFENYLISVYPDDLILEFKEGKLSINKIEPFAIPVGTALPENKFKNLVVFRTNEDLTVNEIVSTDSFVVAGKDRAYALRGFDKDGEYLGYNIISYNQIGTKSVNKNVYTSYINNWVSIISKIMPLIVFLGSFFIFIIFFILNMFVSLVFTFIVILVSMLKGWQFNYEEGYKVALTMTVPALFLGLILSLLGAKIPMQNLIILIILLVLFIPKNRREHPDYKII